MEAPSAPVICVSPHLDDGALSCGQVLARHPGSKLVTVFAGRPTPSQPLTDWDRAAGFTATSDAVTTRRQEDLAAATELEAEPVHWPFLDAQYRHGSPPAEDVVDRLVDELAGAPVLIPLGLFHDDHHFVHAACVEAIERAGPGFDHGVAFYEDCPYRCLDGGRLRDDALNRLQQRWPLRLHVVHDAELGVRKQTAVAAYTSQLGAIADRVPDALADVARPERYWVVGDDGWL